MAQKLFLNVRQHKGVYHSDGSKLHAFPNFEDFYLNLNSVIKLYFGSIKTSYYKKNEETGKAESYNEELECIRFFTTDLEECFSLHFDSSGMGEYHRYKRQIDEYLIGGSDNVIPQEQTAINAA